MVQSQNAKASSDEDSDKNLKKDSEDFLEITLVPKEEEKLYFLENLEITLCGRTQLTKRDIWLFHKSLLSQSNENPSHVFSPVFFENFSPPPSAHMVEALVTSAALKTIPPVPGPSMLNVSNSDNVNKVNNVDSHSMSTKTNTDSEANQNLKAKVAQASQTVTQVPPKLINGIVGHHTQLSFKSQAADIYIMLEISHELFQFSLSGDFLYTRMLRFMKTSLERMRAKVCDHELTIILFGRSSRGLNLRQFKGDSHSESKSIPH